MVVTVDVFSVVDKGHWLGRGEQMLSERKSVLSQADAGRSDD